MIEEITASVQKWCIDNKIPDDHGFSHYQEVSKHAKAAVKDDTLLKPSEKQAIILAALLHDVDDPKIASFLPSTLSTTARSYPIASSFLKDVVSHDQTNLVLEMISYVSCSTNGDVCLKNVPQWKYIPRDADRSQAIGTIGIRRCFEYTQRMDRYLITKDTPLVYDHKGLDVILSKRSLEMYVKSGGKSLSMVDHYYDKLFHLQPTSNNLYMIHLFEAQHFVMKKWLFHFCGALSMCELQSNIRCSKQELVLTDDKETDKETYKELQKSHKRISVNQLATIAPGLNIEGGFPFLDISEKKLPWVNLVVVLDCPLMTKVTFDELQKHCYEKNYPLLENGVKEIQEQCFLTVYLAIISYYLENHSRITVHVHQSQKDAFGLISILQKYLNLLIDSKQKKIDFRSDNPFYTNVRSKTIEGTILISLSQCAGFSLKPGTFLVPDTFIPFDADSLTIDTNKMYKCPNQLISDLPFIMSSDCFQKAKQLVMKMY